MSTQRRVRELDSLPLAVGKAEISDSNKGGKRKTKEEEEMERFVRSTKGALEKLHRENENLRANSASNQKYMDVVRENKTLKQALADRDRQIVTLGDKLNSYKDQVEKKAKIDEKCRSLERQLKGEIEKTKTLQVLIFVVCVYKCVCACVCVYVCVSVCGLFLCAVSLLCLARLTVTRTSAQGRNRKK